MKKTIYNKFDKHAIAALPRVTFPGRIITIISPGETEKAVDYLLSQSILGVDTETRPSFHKGKHYKVCLLQVSTHDTCFLFRLHLTGMTPAIIRLLEDRNVPKVGLSWHDDIIELQDVAPKVGIEDMSLQKLYANLFGQKISKTQRLSNWETDILKDSQKLYAATDAWTCINLYEEMIRLVSTKDFDLIKVPEPEPKVVEVAEEVAQTPEIED